MDHLATAMGLINVGNAGNGAQETEVDIFNEDSDEEAEEVAEGSEEELKEEKRRSLF